jgi:hypothetical protein
MICQLLDVKTHQTNHDNSSIQSNKLSHSLKSLLTVVLIELVNVKLSQDNIFQSESKSLTIVVIVCHEYVLSEITNFFFNNDFSSFDIISISFVLIFKLNMYH